MIGFTVVEKSFQAAIDAFLSVAVLRFPHKKE